MVQNCAKCDGVADVVVKETVEGWAGVPPGTSWWCAVCYAKRKPYPGSVVVSVEPVTYGPDEE